MKLPRFCAITGTLLTLIFLASCGQNGGGTGNTGTGTPLPTATGGPVTLSVDATSYHPGDTITIALKNQSSQTIYFLDHLTNCTVIELDMQVASVWNIVNKCKLLSPTGIHSLDAGQSLTVQLTPTSTNPWPIGVLRASLSYGTVRLFGEQKTVINSAAFQVS